MPNLIIKILLIKPIIKPKQIVIITINGWIKIPELYNGPATSQAPNTAEKAIVDSSERSKLPVTRQQASPKEIIPSGTP